MEILKTKHEEKLLVVLRDKAFNITKIRNMIDIKKN